jgi:hypothetical protein
MAHFARVDDNNIVTEVVVVDNEVEHRGQEFLAIDLELGGRWIQTSYNSNFRGIFAAIGYWYDEVNDIFVAPVTEQQTETLENTDANNIT